MKNYDKIVKKFLNYRYYDENGELIKLKEKINKIGGKDKNTCLHYCVINDNKELY